MMIDGVTSGRGRATVQLLFFPRSSAAAPEISFTQWQSDNCRYRPGPMPSSVATTAHTYHSKTRTCRHQRAAYLWATQRTSSIT